MRIENHIELRESPRLTPAVVMKLVVSIADCLRIGFITDVRHSDGIH